ncbi:MULTISPECIES: ATP-grasp domain-containing protein [Streptomyces]|uniref:Carboxylase n=1 Tax=Streptomyces spororaveus TaxID=284039 RepID=A0ABQ3TGR4_9ACTN|nr:MULTISPECIES: ATP-grasp domain-containing protein [Streptomyces]MCM9080053.1 ATP-grasp domain-containing protein [Streptomyces spororaveus]MCX5305533.1 ATP-grasp domain-containing protein [Streptomyces sp. NBC_00160]GHI79601.1 carboxylase [Streptomyces spororaveus]
MSENILVIGSGDQHFRDYALRGLAERHRVLLIAQTPLAWQAPYVADHREVELKDRAQVLAAARELAALHDVAGVLTWDEMQVRVAAEVGAELGVATMPVEAARACRDKARQRERFRATGVASARYELAGSEAEAAAAAETIGYPVVLKPRGQAASIAVRIVRSEAELRETFALVRDAENPSIEDGLVLVEEFLAGPEIAVDSWVLDGKVVPFSISAKRTGYPPYFEEVAHVVGKVLDARTEAAVREVVIAANEALGIDRAVTHTELMLTADGPKVVEVNGRLGGDLIPHLAEIAAPGLSIGGVLGAVATGREPGPMPEPDRLVGIRFLYPAADLTFDDIEVPAGLADEPWVHEVRRVSEPGTELRLPPRQFLGRAGFVIATGDSVSDVDERLLALADKVTLAGTPLGDQNR